MKNTQQNKDLDPNYWVRLGDGRVVSRMHYDRVTAPPMPQKPISPEKLAEKKRKYNEQVLKSYKERGLPLSDLEEICGLLIPNIAGND